MKVVIINKSDSTGGAAVVSRRLMEALRREGVDASMLVAEKLTDSPYVELAASPKTIKRKFLLERLKIFLANGFNRSTLFKIDTGEVGLPLWRHPRVKEADAVLINWVNQGMLSLKGVGKILDSGKPVIVTMHDMWWMTGVCHHAGTCTHFHRNCGDCFLLGKKRGSDDLSRKTHRRKERIYSLPEKICFVAVSNWLKRKAELSSLLGNQRVDVIANAFPLQDDQEILEKAARKEIRILFGAARLDDPIKGLDTFKEAIKVVAERMQPAVKCGTTFFGRVKDPGALEGFALPVEYLGEIRGETAVERVYRDSDIVVSASSYETLPGTLVEGQAYGCIPVAFNQGGQPDIIEEGKTGFLVEYDEEMATRARNLADGILKALDVVQNLDRFQGFKSAMLRSVKEKFSYQEIARRYMELIKTQNDRQPDQ